MSPRAEKCALALLLLYAGWLVWPLVRSPNGGQWDLQAYYDAGRAVSAGRDPYGSGEVEGSRGGFLYPPATLPLWWLLSRASPNTAHYLFLSLKLAALAALIVVWKRCFLGRIDAAFGLLCVAGFNAAIYVDVRAGNVSVFEQLGLWLAFAAYVRGRLWWFTFLVVSAASFKITPLAFLLLLALAHATARAKAMRVAAGCATFALVHGMAGFVSPELTHRFAAQAAALSERGLSNPATWPMIEDVFKAFEGSCLVSVPDAVPGVVYMLLCILVLVASVRAMRRVAANGDPRVVVYLACLTYALVMPRFKDYSYILLLVPAYWAIQQFRTASAYPLLLLALVFSPAGAQLPGWREFSSTLLQPYFPLLLAYALWAMALTHVARSARAAPC